MIKQRSSLEQLPLYVPGKKMPHAIKLSANENPYPPLDSVLETVREAAPGFHLYPDMGAVDLIARIAQRLEVRPEEISVGAGSIEVLGQIINASADEGDEVIFAWRSFEAYPILTQVAGAKPVMIPLTADERHDLPAMAAAVTDRTRVILLCTPNNPTGTSLSTEEIEGFLASVPSDVLVVIDEAYVHFNTDENAASGIDFFRRYDNVAVLHTFSKAYGLAGLRVGYAVAPERIAANLRRVAMPFAVNTLAQVAAIASLDAEPELQKRVDTLVGERARVTAELRSMGWSIPEPYGNFVWLRVETARIPEVDAALLEKGVVTRAYPSDGVRVTIGSPEMNDTFLEAIRAVTPE